MRSLNSIIGDIRAHIAPVFPAARFTSIRNSKQLLQEIRTIHPDTLPAAFLVIREIKYTEGNRIRMIHLSVIAADQFRAGDEARAVSVWEKYEALQQLFPAEGILLNGIFCIPVSAAAENEENSGTCVKLCFDLLLEE